MRHSRNILNLTAFLLCLVLMSALGSAGPKAKAPTRILLPLIADNYSPITVYDLNGNVQPWSWLVDNFGPIPLSVGGSPAVSELHAVEGPVALVTSGLTPHTWVVFYWPGAPLLAEEYWGCGLDRGIIIQAKEDGRAEFAMGGGSYYFPPDVGPHWVWAPPDSDCLGGMGMLGGTNHTHLDSVWQ